MSKAPRTLDLSKPLRLGFTFAHEANQIGELIEAYKQVGIPEGDIDPVDPIEVSKGLAGSWRVAVYARGTEEQRRLLIEKGFYLKESRAIGPYK